MAILCKTVYVVVLNYEWDITNTLKCDVDSAETFILKDTDGI